MAKCIEREVERTVREEREKKKRYLVQIRERSWRNREIRTQTKSSERRSERSPSRDRRTVIDIRSVRRVSQHE